MPYKLIDFDGVLLPRAMPEDDLSAGTVESALQESISGVYDRWGPSQRLPRRQRFSHQGRYVAAIASRVTTVGDTRVTSTGDTRVVAQSKIHDLQGQTDDLKAKIGVKGPLWRERIQDGARTWLNCRLLSVKHVETVDEAGVISEVESNFETSMAAWHSEDEVVVSGNATAGVAHTLVVDNPGLVTVRDALLSVARTSGTLTVVQVRGTGIDFVWTGAISSGQTLTIDDGSKSIAIGTTDAYSGFLYDSGHTQDDWLPLSPGQNVLTVTVVGGNAHLELSYYNQWP